METIVRLVQEGYIIKFEPHPFYHRAVNIILGQNRKYISHTLFLDEQESITPVPAQMIYILEYLEREFKHDKT